MRLAAVTVIVAAGLVATAALFVAGVIRELEALDDVADDLVPSYTTRPVTWPRAVRNPR